MFKLGNSSIIRKNNLMAVTHLKKVGTGATRGGTNVKNIGGAFYS